MYPMRIGTSSPGEWFLGYYFEFTQAFVYLLRNVMIADDNVTPILMDFGSTMKARVHIENRSLALLQQDIAAEQSTMAYRAPELFDVKTGNTIDEKVDIWVRHS